MEVADNRVNAQDATMNRSEKRRRVVFNHALVLGLGLQSALSGLSAAPEVSNVRAEQRPGMQLVDITYDLADPGSAALTVIVEVSDNAGSTYAVPASSFTGDVGSGIAPGIGKRIVWDAEADWPGRFSANMRFRVTAQDAAPVPEGMVLIPAGSFTMGDTFSEGYVDERPVHTVFVSGFYMDRTEVTNDLMVEVMQWAYDQGKVRATSSTVRNLEGNGRELLDLSSSYCRITWNGSSFAMKAEKGSGYPCVGVTWYGAAAFCSYRSQMEGRTPCYDLEDWSCNWSANGYRLPTEAEWEKAARGGLSGKRFPWGDTISHSQANYYSTSDASYDISPTRGYHPDYDSGDFPYISPVGSFAPNGYGLYDMAGNVWEWCGDWYLSGEYGGAPAWDPRGPPTGWDRVIRGGWFGLDAWFCRVAYRQYDFPGYGYSSDGFRSVLPPGQ